MTTQKHLDSLARKLEIGAVVCLGLIFAWVFFAQPGPLSTAQASEPANLYEAENTKLQAEANLLKRENERLRKELDEAKKVKSAAASTDAQGPSTPQPATAQKPAEVTRQRSPFDELLPGAAPTDLEALFLSKPLSQNAVYQKDPTGILTPIKMGGEVTPRRPRPSPAPVPVAADRRDSAKSRLSDAILDNNLLHPSAPPEWQQPAATEMSKSHRCPVCGMSGGATGGIQTVDGTVLRVFMCGRGHEWLER